MRLLAARFCAFALLFCLTGVASAQINQKKSMSDANQAAKFNAQLGVAYLQRGDVSLAQEKIERALTQNANDADVQTAAGLLYSRVGEMDKAEKHYQAAVKADPRDPNRVNNYAVFLCQRGGFEKGQSLLEEVAKNPRYATPEVAWTNAGVCALSANDADRAERDFKQAVALRPTYPDALLQLIVLNYSRGDLINARGHLTRFLSIATPTADALLLGVKIERAAGDPMAAADYEKRLRKMFPDSPQVGQLEEGGSQ